MVKFGERFHGKEGVEDGNRDGVSGGKKRFFGVDKQKNRWRARVTNPLLRTRAHLGLFRTPEEAALAVEKKKAEFEEMIKGQESLRMGTCRGYFKGKKFPGGWGVRRQIGRNRVHIRHLKLKNWVSVGSYRACEDVAIVADKKKEEFLETNGGNVGKLRVMTDDVNVPPGVKRTQSGKWVARIKMPESKDRNWFGIYNTLEEAIGSFNKKNAEFDAKQKKPEFDSAESGSGSEASESEGEEVETRGGDPGMKKRFLGVDKQGNRWRARARNPLLRATVHLGYYGTPEKAARVVKKKRAEFEEILKGMDCSGMGTCRGCIEGKNLHGGGRKKKRAEFEETFEGSDSSSMGTCKGYFERKKFHGKEGTRDGVSGAKKRFLGVDKVGNRGRTRVSSSPQGFEMFKGQESSSMGTCRDYFEGKKLPGGWGVRRNREHIRHPKSMNWVSGGFYRACVDVAIVADRKKEKLQEIYRGEAGKLILMSGDAISAFNKKKAEFDAKQNSQKWPEFESAEFRSGSEASESPVKFVNELGYDRPTLLLSAHNLNNVALDDNSMNDCGVVDIPGKLGDGLVYSSPTSVSDPKNTSTASVGDKTFVSEFDRALGLGIIDEYGQLLGKYGEFDTHMWLRPT